MEKIQKEVEDWKRKADTSVVHSVIAALLLVIACQSGLFYPYASIAAFEEVVDVARSKGDERSTRFSAILRQCRSLSRESDWKSLERYQNWVVLGPAVLGSLSQSDAGKATSS